MCGGLVLMLATVTSLSLTRILLVYQVWPPRVSPSHQPTNFVNLDHERVFEVVKLGLVVASLTTPIATFTYMYKYQQGIDVHIYKYTENINHFFVYLFLGVL